MDRFFRDISKQTAGEHSSAGLTPGVFGGENGARVQGLGLEFTWDFYSGKA